MKKLMMVAVVLSMFSTTACEKKSGTAPSTDPNKPGASRKLTVTVSGDHTITQGETDDVMVNINRDNFKEDVTIEVKDLPPGVTVDSKDMVIVADKSNITVRLKAAANAAPTTDAVFHIVGKSKDITSETLNVKLTVKAK